MAEYIDRDKLLRDIDHYHVSDGKFQHWVEIQLAADVAPVVHGHWVYKRRRSGGFRIRTGLLKNGERVKVLIDEREDTMEPFCSVCGTHNDSTNDQNMRYCPNCGAKMDVEERNEKPQG